MNIRQMLSNILGVSFGGKRDIYEAVGYTKTPNFNTYFTKYQRGLGGTIVDLMPTQCFSQFPDIVVNEEVNEEVTKLFNDKIFSNLVKADKYSGINNYSVMLLGFNDGQDLSTEVLKATELLYTSPFMENQIKIAEFDLDATSEHFGQPLIYQLNVQNTTNTKQLNVHHSRVLHLAENPLCVKYLGTPRLQRVLNNLDNIEKISASNGETYWKNSTNGLAFIADKDSELTDESLEKMKEQIDEYEHGYSRFLKLRGIDPKKLDNSPVPPTEYLNSEIKMISGIIGIPVRLLVGSENGLVSSITDDKNWENKVQNRRDQYITPFMLQPLLEKLIKVGVIADKDYQICWQYTNSLSESEKVANNLKRAMILEKMVNLENNPLSEDEIKELIN